MVTASARCEALDFLMFTKSTLQGVTLWLHPRSARWTGGSGETVGRLQRFAAGEESDGMHCGR